MITREEFLEFYKNVPESKRSMAVIDLEKYGPCSWRVVFLEINANTKVSKLMLEIMDEKCLNCLLRWGVNA